MTFGQPLMQVAELRNALKNDCRMTVGGVEVQVPREDLLHALLVTERYTALSGQLRLAEGQNQPAAGTQARKDLERACKDQLREYLGVCMLMHGCMDAETLEEPAAPAEPSPEPDPDRDALQQRLGAVAAAQDRFLLQLLRDGTITRAEHDASASKSYLAILQEEAEEYKAALAEEAKDTLQGYIKDVRAGRLSHADYFALTGEEYTVAAGVEPPEEPEKTKEVGADG